MPWCIAWNGARRVGRLRTFVHGRRTFTALADDFQCGRHERGAVHRSRPDGPVHGHGHVQQRRHTERHGAGHVAELQRAGRHDYPAGVATSIAEGDAKISASYQGLVGASDVSVRVLWTVLGRVVSNPDGGGVPGARVMAEDGQAATTVAGGEFTLQGPGTPLNRRVTISADGFVTRTAYLRTNEPRSGILLDVIAQRPPFSLDFFRELARGAEDFKGSPLLQILRWESSPSFYIKTTNQSSLDLSPGVIAELRTIIPAIVAQVSSGRLTVGAIEAGREARPVTAGWINIEFTSEISSCGLAAVGGNYVKVNPICSCYASIEAHEIAHALGLWHHSQPGGLMSHVAPTYCGTVLSELESYHARIVYTRARGNIDPDSDPVTAALSIPGDTAVERVVSCWPIRR